MSNFKGVILTIFTNSNENFQVHTSLMLYELNDKTKAEIDSYISRRFNDVKEYNVIFPVAQAG